MFHHRTTMIVAGLALALLAGLLDAAPARAGAAEGWQAYLAGDYRAARAELVPAAEAGDAAAQYALGVLYAHGKGVVRDSSSAILWYRRAAEQGHAEAAFNLGFLLYQGYVDATGAEVRDEKEAYRWLLASAKGGNAMAQALVGEMTLEGEGGVAADAVTAFSWLARAAEKGIAKAQFLAAQMLARGNGTARDDAAAYRYLIRLKAAGYPGIEHDLDMLGHRLAPDLRQAIERESGF